MTMTYVNIKLNDEVYKYIFVKLNRNSSRKYQTMNEIFENLKKMHVDSNKIQTAINAFIKLIQMSKFVEFHTF